MSSQKNNPSLLFFYLLILFLPIQFGKHFWPSSSFVYGIRVDYLSPTLYLTDILILLILGTYFFKKINLKKLITKKVILVIAIFILLTTSALFAKNQLSAFYGIIKFLEFLLLAIFISRKLKNLAPIYLLMSFSVIYESVIATAQFINQGSLGGLFYFLGERTFNGQTPGIANASLGGELVLRAYGTFPHPNVLAGFLVVFMAVILTSMTKEKGARLFYYWTALVVGTLALFLTLSRTSIIVWVFAMIFILLLKKGFGKKTNLALILTIILILSFFLLSPLLLRFTHITFEDPSIYDRRILFDAGVAMFFKNPVLGVGFNNFLVNLPVFIKNISLHFLQPVHNIYLLILVETGIFGFLAFLSLLFLTFRKIGKKSVFFPAFLIIIFIGLFDHYFLTLQQGQILFAITFGFCWAKSFK
ncbi:MAG: O-antigen ligase family protein [Candidatus Levyibacteriota bacterium]